MPKGTYRVLVNGFLVKTETWDNALQTDGKRDEVFLSTSVAKLTTDGDIISPSEVVSDTLGDVNGQPGRVQAGSASPQGGLRTNDKFPTPAPWRSWTDAEPPPEDQNYPPMAVWEGELDSDRDVLLVTPSIWEWDGGESAAPSWIAWGQQTVEKIAPKVEELVDTPATKLVFSILELGLDVAVSMTKPSLVGQSADRPIGMVADGENFVFKPQVLVLTQPKAEAIVNSRPAGKGKGVLALSYKDAPALHGHYQLYMQVQKL
jgi:hypothetical protein